MSFYGVIEEIWELSYNSFKVAIFKCDWVENSGGIKTDELGFVLVDLSRVGQKNDSFRLATQAKQVFFVEDLSDSRWSIVLTPPQRDFEDQYNEDELGDTVLNCQGMSKATLDIKSRLDLDENTPTYIDSYPMELPTNGDLTLGLDGVEIVDGQSMKAIIHLMMNHPMMHRLKLWVLQNMAVENVVKEKKEIATSVPLISFTSKNKVVEEDEVKEEEVKEDREVIVTRPSISKNEVKALRPMTKEVEVTSEPSNLPIQLKYLYSLIIDLKKVSKYVFVDPSLISADHSTWEIRARNLCSRLMTSKQDQLVVAPNNPEDHLSLVVINPYDDVVYHLDSLRTSSRDDIKYVTNMALTIFQYQKNLNKTKKTTFWKACPLQVGTVECGYYVMRYMHETVSKDSNIITDAIDSRNSYSQLELDEIRVKWAEFLACHYTYIYEAVDAKG
ncbi:transposase [Cucumis melo var. makuwa]|uniref:Transposase n=1 Tax=Cucumis melo var. makuwa TaxID=1194695 RepID=A0A5D3CDE6_CUCMM|nr:transposase [Cucumis melo var. makuwa]